MVEDDIREAVKKARKILFDEKARLTDVIDEALELMDRLDERMDALELQQAAEGEDIACPICG